MVLVKYESFYFFRLKALETLNPNYISPNKEMAKNYKDGSVKNGAGAF